MSKQFSPDIGDRFGRLVFLNKGEKSGDWLVLCDCGEKKEVRGADVKRGKALSCGCLRKELTSKRLKKHGKEPAKTYYVWKSMRERCMSPAQKNYGRYGGRGIKVCDRWNDFSNFLEDMGEKPEGLTLERINNDGDYSPENCRWVDRKVQANNTSRNRYYPYNGEMLTLSQISDLIGINKGTLRTRVHAYGWPLEKAFTTPVKPRPKLDNDKEQHS